jgi:hypothetical protein
MPTRNLVTALVLTLLSLSAAEARADEPPAPATSAPPATPATPSTPPVQAESPTVAPSIAADPGRPKLEDRIIDTPTPARTFPAIGGHLGMALPIATFSSRTTAIGEDFVTVGLTPGLTVHLDEKWAIDFEFIAFNEVKNTPAATTFIVDPGILRKFDGFVAGLRVATQVGAPTNSGLVPIFVVPFKIGARAVWFVELDIPLFVRDAGPKALFSATALFQTGVGF